MQSNVSVVVPTYNRPDALCRALASIRALEGPDLRIEIIVADNGGLPAARAAAEEFGARYIPVELKGPSAARNAGMLAATGDYIAFLDDDDVWMEGHLRPHLALFAANPDLELVIGQVQSVDHNHVPFGDPWLAEFPATPDDLLRRMLSGYFPQVGSIVVRTHLREAVGGFDTALPGGEDLDWLLRIAARRKVAFTATPCVLFTHRPIGTFDELQLSRSHYDRLVFNRYALRWWKLWRSPAEYMRAYSGTMMHYYRYFVDTALERAERGEKRKAAISILHAMRVFPFRSIKHLIGDTRLRKAVLKLASSNANTAAAYLPVWFVVHLPDKFLRFEHAVATISIPG